MKYLVSIDYDGRICFELNSLSPELAEAEARELLFGLLDHDKVVFASEAITDIEVKENI